MGTFNLKGLGVAIITPFNPDKTIDLVALANLVERLASENTDYIVVLGTTGETPTLSESERKQICDTVVKHNAGRVPLVLGVGGNNTLGVVESLKSLDLTGFDAILSVVPYYNKPSQEGIFQHYKTIAEASPLPIILYNVPGRTGVNMSAQTTLRLAAEVDNIAGIKEASGNIKQIKEIIDNKPSGFQVVSGDDSLTSALMEIGAVGVISVAGNAIPKYFSRIVNLCQNKCFQEAYSLQAKADRLMKLLFVDGNPAGIKAALSALGQCQNVLRLPLVPACSNTCSEIDNIITEFID